MGMFPSSPPPPGAYTPALFPMQMFPSLALMAAAAQPPTEPAAAKQERQEKQDELLEVGLMVALMKMVLG